VTIALHAHRILEAWDGFNYARFEAELESALTACNSSIRSSELEREERAVIESVVRELQCFPAVTDTDDHCWWEARFFLLRHLQTR
jgi:hypothetical protein